MKKMTGMKTQNLYTTLVVFSLLLSFLALLSCQSQKSGKLPKKGKVLALVNGDKITQGDLDAVINGLPPRARNFYKSPHAQKQILDNLITNELLYREAMNRGINKKPDVIHQMETQRRQVMVRSLLEQVTKERTTDDVLRKKFEEDKDRYSKPQVKASHILIKDEALAKQVYQRAKKGEDFGKLAEKYSEDPSNKKKGGDLGWFPRERMVKEFSDKAFSMKVGEISTPVKTRYGYHIIKVTDKRESQPFEDVKDRVASDLKRTSRQDYIAELKSSAKIDIKAKELSSTDPHSTKKGAFSKKIDVKKPATKPAK